MFTSKQPGAPVQEKSSTPTHPTRVMLILDVDHTLFEVTFPETERLLSRSAEACLFPEMMRNVCVVNDCVFGIDHANVRALCREEWNAVFMEVNALNQEYRELCPEDKELLVGVKLMTYALYTHNEFRNNLFAKVFGEEMTAALFPGNFFSHYFNDQRRHFEVVENKAQLLNKLFVGREVLKYETMKIEFCPGWAAIPGMARENIWLIDNESRNCDEMGDHQFGSIFFPSTPHSRPSLSSFEAEKKAVFQKIHDQIDKARQSLQAIRKERAAATNEGPKPGL